MKEEIIKVGQEKRECQEENESLKKNIKSLAEKREEALREIKRMTSSMKSIDSNEENNKGAQSERKVR